jgi:hypothetical protein
MEYEWRPDRISSSGLHESALAKSRTAVLATAKAWGKIFHLGGGERADEFLHQDLDKIGIGIGFTEAGLPKVWELDFDSVREGAARRATRKDSIKRREANPEWFPP